MVGSSTASAVDSTPSTSPLKLMSGLSFNLLLLRDILDNLVDKNNQKQKYAVETP